MERIPVRVGAHSVTAFSEGDGDDAMLVVHGGPGVPSNYVRDAHLRYAEEGFRVVSWDQLGCGESDRPDDDSLWTVERYVEEMETVRSALGLGRVSVVGNSWGGMLGLEYCLAHAEQREVLRLPAASPSTSARFRPASSAASRTSATRRCS